MKLFLATALLSFMLFGSGVSAAEFSDTELSGLGHSYVQAINDLDVDALNALISSQHLAREIAAIAGDDDAEQRKLVRAFQDSVPNINQRMIGELERQGATARFLRIHTLADMRGPLVRVSLGDGYNYILLKPVRPARTSTEVQIGDLYFATSGERLSESMGIATKLMISPSDTFLGKVFGVGEIDRDLATRFMKVGQLRQQNKLQEAYDVLDQMQGSIRNHRLILTNTIQIAAQLDDQLYLQELRRMATHHKDDPRVAFTLLDYYFFENDFESAWSIIDLMEQTYGLDAVIYVFRANVESARNRADSAINFAEKAVQLEPDNEDAQWVLLSSLVQGDMFEEGVAVLQVLESEFGYAFSREDFDVEPLYDVFVQSEEFARWIKAP